MKKKLLSLGMALLLLLGPVLPVWAQSGGNCSVFRSWITGDSLTAGDLTSSFSTVGVTNMTQACLDGISDTVAGMQTQTDPFASQTESLATSGAGEIQRLRFILQRVFGVADWYRHDQNVNFGGMGITRTNVQGAGMGAHVTAVGLHVWGGSQRFPSITGRYVHTTGFFWPAAHHLAIAIDPANEADKGGVEMFRFHAQGMTLHHSAAIMFRHSAAWNPQWQYPHITAISLSRGRVSAADNEAAGRDTLLFGHAGAVMNLVGYGASHIALGAGGTGSYIALGRHVVSVTPAKNALYAETSIKAFAFWSGGTAGTPPLAAFNVAGITDVDTGQYIVRWIVPFASANYAANVVGGNGDGSFCLAVLENQATTHAVVRTLNVSGVPIDCGSLSIIVVGLQ